MGRFNLRVVGCLCCFFRLSEHFKQRSLNFTLPFGSHSHFLLLRIVATLLLLFGSVLFRYLLLLLLAWIKPWWCHEVHAWVNLERPRAWNLKTRLQENADTVKHKFWSWRVVVTFHNDDIFIACIPVVNSLRVSLVNKVVVLSSNKECRDEAFVGMSYWRNLSNVEICLSFDRGLYASDGNRNDKIWDVNTLFLSLFNHFFCQLS
mmetsp:Transcript_1415/g.2191  ORF Transcript_1415/g.2191 Transcript_1415/m.2191 type:complete len:205 (-) Transcript_1415:816-1430(-)